METTQVERTVGRSQGSEALPACSVGTLESDLCGNFLVCLPTKCLSLSCGFSCLIPADCEAPAASPAQ